MRMPRHVRRGKRQATGEILLDEETLVVQRGKRTDSTAELHDECAFARDLDSLQVAIERADNPGELQSQRDRQRLLQPGAPREDRRRMRTRALCEQIGKPDDITRNERQRVAQLE